MPNAHVLSSYWQHGCNRLHWIRNWTFNRLNSNRGNKNCSFGHVILILLDCHYDDRLTCCYIVCDRNRQWRLYLLLIWRHYIYLVGGSYSSRYLRFLKRVPLLVQLIEHCRYRLSVRLLDPLCWQFRDHGCCTLKLRRFIQCSWRVHCRIDSNIVLWWWIEGQSFHYSNSCRERNCLLTYVSSMWKWINRRKLVKRNYNVDSRYQCGDIGLHRNWFVCLLRCDPHKR